MIEFILLILIVIAFMAPISILAGKIMKSNVPVKKNAIIGCVAFLSAGIIGFLGNMIYYKYFVAKVELYQYKDTLAGRLVVTTVLFAIIGWIVTLYIVNKKKGKKKEN